MTSDKEDEVNADREITYQPTFDPDDFTVNDVTNRLANLGNSDFIAKADARFAKMTAAIKALRDNQQHDVNNIRLLDLPDIEPLQQPS